MFTFKKLTQLRSAKRRLATRTDRAFSAFSRHILADIGVVAHRDEEEGGSLLQWRMLEESRFLPGMPIGAYR